MTETKKVNLALFDFDGTLTTREMLPDFYHSAVPPRRLAVGKLVLAPLVIGYKLGLVSGVLIRTCLAAVGFRGVPQARVWQAGEAFAAQALPPVLRPEAMARLAWHQAQGDVVVVVSGAFDVYLAPWCRQHGVDLICSALESRDGVLTGRYAGAQCVREEKARRVRERYDLTQFAEVYAYGDTPEDHALLALASKAYYRGREVERPVADAGAAPCPSR